MTFFVGQAVRFAGIESVVREIGERDGRIAYLVENGLERLPMWIPGDVLSAHQGPGRPPTIFNRRTPHVIAVDDFFRDPDQVRALALAQLYVPDLRYYKGLRSEQRFLWPHLREEFGRLLGTPVVEWLGHTANGVFQLTDHRDPLVWHHDRQGYAAAVYLTPDAPRPRGRASGGTGAMDAAAVRPIRSNNADWAVRTWFGRHRRWYTTLVTSSAPTTGSWWSRSPGSSTAW